MRPHPGIGVESPSEIGQGWVFTTNQDPLMLLDVPTDIGPVINTDLDQAVTRYHQSIADQPANSARCSRLFPAFGYLARIHMPPRILPTVYVGTYFRTTPEI